jgi:UDP-glucuronate 4-epimerase
MKILVTGGAGFIGSATAKRLSDDGHQVIVVDNFNTYYDQQLKRDRITALVPHVQVVELDITNADEVDHLFAEHAFDAVCHFAAQAGVRYSVDAPEVYVTTNVLGTQTLLETMRKHQVLRFNLVSVRCRYTGTL